MAFGTALQIYPKLAKTEKHNIHKAKRYLMQGYKVKYLSSCYQELGHTKKVCH